MEIHTLQHKRIIMLAASALTFGYFVIWYLFHITAEKDAFFNWHKAPTESYLLSCAILMMCGVVVLLIRALEDHRRMVFAQRYDAATELPNGIYLRNLLHELSRKGKLEPSDGLLVIGIDGLVSINIAHGYDVGNQFIRSAADRLSGLVNRDCVLVRLKGDMFGILVRNVSGRDEISHLAYQILEAKEEEFSVGEITSYLSFSIGAVMLRDTDDGLDQLVRQAELSLLHARTQPGVDFVFYSDQLSETAERLGSLEMELRKAIETGQIEVYYQPIIDSKSGQIVCVEALSRWTHPKFGVISPSEFIPLAESIGMNEKLGNAVLNKACREIKAVPCLCLAVNIGPNHLLHPEFVQNVIGVLDVSGLEASRLEIEITESTYIEMPDKVRSVVHQLRKHGVSVAIDDFGTGYSSLSRLRELEVDRVKVDAAFVKELGKSQKAAELFESIVKLVELTGANITVEGIETVDQLKGLGSFRGFWYQGFLFSKPVSYVDLLRSEAMRSLPSDVHKDGTNNSLHVLQPIAQKLPLYKEFAWEEPDKKSVAPGKSA